MKAAFEKWAKRCPYFVPIATFNRDMIGKADRYARDDIEVAWCAWKAGHSIGHTKGFVEGQSIGFDEGYDACVLGVREEVG